MKRITWVMFADVVASSVALPDDCQLVPQVMARAVPLSLMRITNSSPSFGVPDKFVVIDVTAVACGPSSLPNGGPTCRRPCAVKPL
jgi:hypothetical protein